MNRRAMTLLETLLALALLASLAAACVMLVQAGARHAAPIAAAREWDLSARALLAQIHDDLAVGDATAGPSNGKVHLDADTLSIESRRALPKADRASGIATLAHYRFDAPTATLLHAVRGGPPAAPVLGDLADFAASVSPDGRTLSVRLRRRGGDPLERSFPLR